MRLKKRGSTYSVQCNDKRCSDNKNDPNIAFKIGVPSIFEKVCEIKLGAGDMNLSAVCIDSQFSVNAGSINLNEGKEEIGKLEASVETETIMGGGSFVAGISNSVELDGGKVGQSTTVRVTSDH